MEERRRFEGLRRTWCVCGQCGYRERVKASVPCSHKPCPRCGATVKTVTALEPR